MPIRLTPPIFVALDVDDNQQALELARNVGPYVGGFKVGPRLTYKYGSAITSELAKIKPVFVDNKYHDIPSTMIAGIRASFEAGASFVTIHASCGPEALKQIAKVEAELNGQRPFQILCVTVLTSLGEGIMPANWRDVSVNDHVMALARQVHECGLAGIVCAPDELVMLRKEFPGTFILTPGIRMPGDAKGDQTRVMGPKEAIDLGSSALVVGRPIVAAADPAAAAKKIFGLVAGES